MFSDFASDIFVGDTLLLKQTDIATGAIELEMGVTVTALGATTVVVAENILLGSAGSVAVYRQQSRLIPSDASTAELQSVVESFSLVRSVSVGRQGPTQLDTFSWTLTFTSNLNIARYQFSTTASSVVEVQSCADSSLNGFYISDSFQHGRRSFKLSDGPFSLAYNADSLRWMIYALNHTSSPVSTETATTEVLSPYLTSFSGDCQILDVWSPFIILQGSSAAVESSLLRRSVAPDMERIDRSAYLGDRVPEVQSVQLTSDDGLLFGGFELDFNNSGIRMTFRVDEEAEDFATKLRSLSTIGVVNVTRSTLENSLSAFIGYKWFVTFLSNSGDLPVLEVNPVPIKGDPVSGNGINLVVVQERRGTPTTKNIALSNLTVGTQYTAQVFPQNSAGTGISSLYGQDKGVGLAPLSFEIINLPDTPVIEYVIPRSSSQLELKFTPPNNGGSEIFKYLVEYSTDGDFGFASNLSFTLTNFAGNSSYGVWRMRFDNADTYYIRWAATAEEVKAAIENIGTTLSATVTRSEIYYGLGTGYQYDILMMGESGTLSLATFSVDISQLVSSDESNSFAVNILSQKAGFTPMNYRSQWLYASCKQIRMNITSDHQVLTIATAVADVFGTGSYRLMFDRELTSCIDYSASLDTIYDILMDLSSISYVFLEEFKRVDSKGAYRDIHIFIEGELVNEWPQLRIVPYDNGKAWSSSSYPQSCVAASLATTKVSIVSLEDRTACSGGSSEVQVIVAEAEYSLAGYFYVYFQGLRSSAIAVSSTASDVATAVNALLSSGSVSVTRFIHRDPPRSGFAWAITFSKELGNVEFLVADDQHIIGVHAAVGVYPLFNITVTADIADITGKLSIAVNDEETIPLSWSATDGAYLNALLNITHVGKVAMIGFRDQELPYRLPFSIDVTSGSLSSFIIYIDISASVSVGDSVHFSGFANTADGRYITGIREITPTSYSFNISEPVTFSSAGTVSVLIGELKFSKLQLPGRCSFFPSTNGTYPTNITLVTSSSWYGYVAAGDLIWVDDHQFLVLISPTSSLSNTIQCLGVALSSVDGAIAFYWGKGFERAFVVKAATTSLRNIRPLLMNDMRGTNLIVTTDHTDGVSPNMVILGSLFAVQTVTFRPDSLAASTAAQTADLALTLTLSLGSEFATSANITYGASPDIWKSAIETMNGVDRVTVTRQGDGKSPLYAYGYAYTIKYWGKYGIRNIPQLAVNGSTIAKYVNIAGVSVYDNIVQHGEIMSHYSSRYVALNENQTYFTRISAFNSRGMSLTSNIATASTELFGGVPMEPQSVVLGRFKTGNSLSLSFASPIHDGGLPVSSYLVEIDASLEFNSSGDSYRSMLLENIPEVQRITTSFRAGDSVKSRGGTFTIAFGGLITAPLPFDVSAYDLQIALNFALGLRSVSVDPVTVTRVPYNRGYKWFVTFIGIRGNMGMLSADGSMLAGDDPRITVAEVTRGFADITPNSYTYEVQSVSTAALSAVSGGFRLTMEGYTTPIIQHDESAASFRNKLESLPTIFTVKVSRVPLSAQFELFTWVITFTHMRKEVVQGAGRLPPLTVASSSLLPSSASIDIFVCVEGTDPLQIFINNLLPGIPYNTRVTAYNDKGFSSRSFISTAVPLGQPISPINVELGIESPSSLQVTWAMPEGFNFFVDSFLVECYSSMPVLEVQVITTSSAASLVEIQKVTIDADVNNIGGFFRLGLGGIYTRNIRWNANAVGEGSVAIELTRLSSVGPVAVTRSVSSRVILGLRVSISSGSALATVDTGITSTISVGDVIFISDEQFTVVVVTSSTIGLSAPLVTASLSNVSVRKWSFGYVWDITFLSKIGDVPLLTVQTSDNWAGTNPVLKASTVRQGIVPIGGTFRVGFRGSMSPPLHSSISEVDMKAALEALETVAEVDVARYTNGYGYDWRVTFKSDLGDIEGMIVNDASLSGPFASAAVSTAVQGVSPSAYTSFIVQGGNSRSAKLTGLQKGVGYQVRVSSHNSMGYSYSTLSSPSFLSPKSAPSVPYSITIFALSKTQLRVSWYQPLDNGGASILQYIVQWDIASTFQNALANGNSRTIDVTPNDGPVFCITIDIVSSSSDIARFARVSASNGYGWSSYGYPTPISATGRVRTPGVPASVYAVPTDSIGILVTWQPPNAASCSFGGDGGMAVTYYVVEWDIREDFSTPASQAFIHNISELVYLIGGRNMLTGKMKTELVPGGSYYVRVTAFNSVGAGAAAYALGPIVLQDQPPMEPRNIRMSPISATEIFASWDPPIRDGGATVEKYRFEYSTNSTFTDYVAVDLPLVHEVQAFAIDSPVTIETQAITLLAHVTNERQIVRSNLVPAVDEVQTLTLFCDDVVNEVQRIVTTANDFDEVQTVELVGTEVHEVQLLQSYVIGVPEVQSVVVSSPRVNEMQVFGAIIYGVDTSSCTAGSTCAVVESGFSGFYRLQFDPNQCGTYSDKIESNWCVIALNDAGVTGYDCSATSCLSSFINIAATAASVQSSICNLKGSGSTTFMTSADGLCVNVSRSSYALNVNSSSGAYAIIYSVEFSGQYVTGNVPPLLVTYSNVTHVSSPAFIETFTNSTGVTTALGSIHRQGNMALTTVEGNQPDGLFTLTYSCEARTVPTVVNVTDVVGSDTSVIAVDSPILVQYQYISIQNKYHQIVSVESNAKRAVIAPAFDLSPYGGISTFSNAQVGAFYSDPSDFYGVSAACYTPSIHITLDMNQSVTEFDMNAKLRALSPVVIDTDDSLTITRSYFSPSANRIGYSWIITFNRQNGDLIPLVCGSASMHGTNTAGGATCIVTTIQNGTLLDGTFSVSVSSPNAYVATPINYSSIDVPWNIDPVSLTSILSSTTGFEVVDISRVPYSAGQSRWSGGYIWTISFTERYGDVPTLVTNVSFIAGSQTATVYTGTHDYPLAHDDPGTAIEGNQVGGYFGFSFTDTNGTYYQSNATAFRVVSNVTGQAITAVEFKAYLVSMLDNQDVVEVERSATYNAAMGYMYRITFTGQVVGGNVQNLNPITSALTHTTTASTSRRVGVLCTNPSVCTVGTFVVNVGISVLELQPGAQLQGSFQLRFRGASTGAIPYNAEAVQVQSAINNLATISPSAVKVSRFGPMRTPANQVFGYVWEITFNSNTWVDPRIDHSTYVDGNWQGAATTWDAVWESGFSKAWGRQVGDQDLMECSGSALYTTYGILRPDACTIVEVVQGTSPLKGDFSLTLDTLYPPHPVINIQAIRTTAPIAFNAFANATESGGDGTSVEERLLALDNIGDISVSRSDVNNKTGGFTWFITFLRDADKAGGQWGDQCEQKDSFFNLCNSPGNVPSLRFDNLALVGTCLDSSNATLYTCPLGLVMTGDSAPSTEPGGSREVQKIYLANPNFDSNFTAGNRFFSLSRDGYSTNNISVQASANEVKLAIESAIPSLSPNFPSRGVIVAESFDPVRAKNGKVFTIYFIDEGDQPQLEVSASLPPGIPVDPISWTATAVTVSNGRIYGLTAAAAEVVNGIVQRGRFTSFFVSDEQYFSSDLRWNAVPEGYDPFSNYSIKSHIEAISGHTVNVTRLVIGKYGIVQYEVRFVWNPGFFPPGAGDIPILNVTQAVASDGILYPPQVYESVKGSNGISGTFDIDLHNDLGPRTVNFDESASRMGRKLEEMSSVGKVHVERSEYPSTISGGWGENLVDDGTLGGYQWKIFFKRNPGVSAGFSYPPGSGNIDPITVSSDSRTLFGTMVTVSVSTISDGSNPLDGTFTLTYDGSTTEPVSFDQQPLETKYLLEGLDSIGQVSVSSRTRLMQRVEGLTVTVRRDSDVLMLNYDSSSTTSVLETVTPGDLIRVGASSSGNFDGSDMYALCEVAPESPIVTTFDSNSAIVLPGESIRIGFEEYTVQRTGVEVQALSITCLAHGVHCGDISLRFIHNGVAFILPSIGGNSSYMTPSSIIESDFNSLNSVNIGDVVVTRSDSLDGLSFLYKFYFEGETVLGNLNEMQSASVCSSCTYSILTLIEGGYTEIQRIRVNVDSGYLIGPFLSLTITDQFSVSYSTPCLEYGVESNDVANALQKLPVLSNRLLPFTATIKAPTIIELSSSCFGLISVGDIITIGNNISEYYTVQAIANGTFLSVENTVYDSIASSGLALSIVTAQSVQVSRMGTGNSTNEVISLTLTADSYIQSGAGGFYRLKLTFKGEERVSGCVDYHASGEDVATTIDSMGFDFNGDGLYTSSDSGHIHVSREGDGTITSGYGYVYRFVFAGPLLAFGRSDVMGASLPKLEVVDEGHYGSCFDLGGTAIASLLIDASVSNGRQNWTTFGGSTTEGIIQSGDRLRVYDSLTPDRTFIVTATGFNAGSNYFTVDGILRTTSTNFVTAYVYSTGIPSFSIDYKQAGEDSYIYDVYMSGPHLSNVPIINPSVCGNFFHIDGMRYGLEAKIIQDGGSQEIQQISMQSTYQALSNETGHYWKIVFSSSAGITVLPIKEGYSWGIQSSDLELSLSALGLGIVVSRSGTGSAEEMFSFNYTLSYPPVHGNVNPLQVLGTGGLSSPLFISGGSFEPSEYVNDLTVTGIFSAAQDVIYYVLITSIANSSVNDSGDGFVWFTSLNGTLSNQVNLTRSKLYTLSYGVSIYFNSSSGHSNGDLWQFAGVFTNDSLPNGATISYRTIRNGSPIINQLTLSTGYGGNAESSVPVYEVAPVYTIASQSILIFELLTQNSTRFALFTDYSGILNISATSTCIDWDSDDLDIEASLYDMYKGACLSSSNCITVTKSVDLISNPDGYKYMIYFLSPIFAVNFRNTLSLVSGSCLGYVAGKASISIVQDGSDHRVFDASSIPLATPSDPNLRAFYKGSGGSALSLFKVSGNDWGVAFDTNIGDLPPLEAKPTIFLSQGASLTTYDNVVKGDHPLSYRLSNVLTGINYSGRVRAYTRGAFHGYGPYTHPTASSVAATVPDAVESFSSSPVLNTYEVQEIIVGAAHIRQVQEIKTTAAKYPEEQMITLTAPVGGVDLSGGFALRFPNIQTIQIRASGTLDLAANYKIIYSYYDFDAFGSIKQIIKTPCISVNADAMTVQAALMNMPVIDSVIVVKSGYGGYSSYFGYTYTISFVGNAVAGDVLPLEVETGGVECSALSTLTGVSFIVSKMSPWPAVGTDTEIQMVNVSSDRPIAQGEYRLSFEYPVGNFQVTSCIPWNASADSFRSAIEGLSNVDSVFVDRAGGGDLTSSFGFTYTVYFTGNALQISTRTSTLGQIRPIYAPGTCIGYDFAAFADNGVLQYMSNSSFEINSTAVQRRGFNLDAQVLDSSALSAILSLLPSYVSISGSSRSLSEDGFGYIYTIVFDETMGDVPQLACGISEGLASIGGICQSSTIIDGNYIRGFFIVGSSTTLAADISALDLQNELNKLQDIGSVAVSRIGPDNQGGFSWLVTFLTASSSIEPFTVTNLLTGAKAHVIVATTQPLNRIGGNYTLSFDGYSSASIPWDASADKLRAILQAPSMRIGGVQVIQSLRTTEAGSVYIVTFLDSPGNRPLLVPSYSSLTGVNAVVKVLERVRGTIAAGDSLSVSYESPLYCSYSQVMTGHCGSPLIGYAIDISTSLGTKVQTVLVNETFDIQIVRTSAPSIFDKHYQTDRQVTGYFQLSFGGAVSSPIDAQASATDLRDILESLSTIHAILVSRDFSSFKLSSLLTVAPGAQSAFCSSIPCDFASLPAGELIQIDGNWYTIHESFRGSDSILPLALASDASIPTFYSGTESSSMRLYRWARGYEWTVTFLSTTGTISSPQLASLKHGLNPPDASVAIRSPPCVKCALIKGLESFTNYGLSLRAYNSFGMGTATSIIGAPKEIPGSPSSITVTGNTGTSLLVTFTMPSVANQQILGYVVQWDTTPLFINASLPSASCDTAGYGRCILTGSAIVSNPIEYIIQNLLLGVQYFIRVAAINVLSSERSNNGNSTIADNNNWSDTVTYTTSNQRPDAPVQVVIAQNGPNHIQVLVTPPINNGGLTISTYKFEWDVVTSFDSSLYGNLDVPFAAPYIQRLLKNNSGVIIYQLEKLSMGNSYFVRVSAANAIGYGLTSISTTSATPATKPSAPTSVSLTYDAYSNPITAIHLSWTAPTGDLADGGSPITGYVVEWWKPGAIYDIQLVRWTSTFFKTAPSGSFYLSYAPAPGIKYTTSFLNFDVSAWNLRSELMNLNYSTDFITRSSEAIPIGHVEVTRQSILSQGYQWLVTFKSTNNEGNQVLLTGAPAASGTGETVLIEKIIDGRRDGGHHEVQLLTILSLASSTPADLGGWFKLSFNTFNGTFTQTQYISVNATAEDVQREINQLSTIRKVTVTKSVILSSASAGYQWQITFSQDIGDQPKIGIDSSRIYSSQLVTRVFIDDGDNSLSADGTKASQAEIGEAPKGYSKVILGKDSRSFLIDSLVPGQQYFIAVSAINSYGIGDSSSASAVSATPPIVVPQPPTNVTVDVLQGSTTQLEVQYNPPLSSGGAPILFYRVELDTTTNFFNPLVSIIPCPASNMRTVFAVQTSGDASGPITSGYFQLIVTLNGISHTTDYIPYDATAMLADEQGIVESIVGVTTSTLTNGSFAFAADNDVSKFVFVNDRIVFSTQKYSAQVFVVVAVVGATVTVDSAIVTISTERASIGRLYGGRDINTQAKIACSGEVTYTFCTLNRRQISGSMQSKLQQLPDMFTEGVTVERDGPDSSNGFIWRVTFLDQSSDINLDYSVAVVTSTLSGGSGNVSTTQLQAGQVYTSCTGYQVVPHNAFLVLGQYYFARVFAVNQVGFSLSQISSSSQKPMVVPGPPTSVTLSVLSNTELRVVFNPPIDDGGDTITSYLVEYSIRGDFSNMLTTTVTYLEGGAPYFKTIGGLTPGIFVFVRVRAGNSQGYGNPQPSTPASLNPYQASAAPLNTELRVTSQTMLTVSFDLPLNNGGDTVTKFRVDWDTVPGFNGVIPYPNKGTADLDSQTYRSYTIQYLSAGQRYYVRVSAINSAGPGAPALSSPTSAVPGAQVPGRPHSIVALSGSVLGSISVSWQRPRVPWHGIPCSGLASAPNDCPPMIGGGLPASDGGLAITEYAIGFNDLPDFSGLDNNNGTGFITTSLSYSLTGLTAGKLYYIRVLARNPQGSGPFCNYVERNCLIVTVRAQAIALA